MDIVKSEWWSTPVWETDIKYDDATYGQMVRAAQDFQKVERGYGDVWSMKFPCFNKLKKDMLDIVLKETPMYFPPSFGYEPTVGRSHISVQTPGENLEMHDHPGSLFVIVYYIACEENSGDLILMDPRGYTNFDIQTGDGQYDAKYKRIKPQVGKMVMFPGYITHGVETNKSSKTRLSLATNIYAPNKRIFAGAKQANNIGRT